MDGGRIGKPIITCITCMASVHTAIVMCIGNFLIGVTIGTLKQWIGLYLLCAPAVAFLNTFFWIILTKLSSNGEPSGDGGTVLEADVP